jgi:hypothetical protein
LIEEARIANEAVGRIQDMEREERNLALVGKFFRYRNNFSCPEKPSDYWWLYVHVLRMEKGGHLIAHQFQTDSHGSITIVFKNYYSGISSGYNEIEQRVFVLAWKKLQARISSYRP